MPTLHEVHRPFASELSKLSVNHTIAKEPTLPQASVPNKPEQRVQSIPYAQKSERPLTPPPPQEHASLATLKMSPKKDKGPSTENLSSLRAVLEASLAAKNDIKTPPPKPAAADEKKESPPPPQPAQKPASLLEEFPQKNQPKEVPEDVLKNLLSD